MIEKFKVNIPKSELNDVKERIKKVRWPDEFKNSVQHSSEKLASTARQLLVQMS